MRIGILPNLSPDSGGVYQYSQNILHALNAWSEKGCDDQLVLLSNNGTCDLSSLSLTRDRWEIEPVVTALTPSWRERIFEEIRQRIGEGPHREALRCLRRRLVNLRKAPTRRAFRDPEVITPRAYLRDCFLQAKLYLLLYPHPTPISFETGLPYMIAVHDLQHRLQPEFPEVAANGEWEYREYLFRHGVRNALMILTDSETGREDVLNFYGQYGIEPDRVKVLPFLPASYLPSEVSLEERARVRNTYALPERFLFYPAQFWPHKNHARIVAALGLLKQQKIETAIVFCGSSDGSIRQKAYKEVMSSAEEHGVIKQIRNLGYVPDQDMAGLYAEAAALVMPTFFGPTNIPVLEAWRFGCPVITSDIRGIREQVG